MVVRHKGVVSEECEMPGGGPQGTNLGILSYLVNINSLGVPLDVITNCVQNTLNGTEALHPVLPSPPYHIEEDSARLKYIDDMSMCQAVDLSSLKPIDGPLQHPLNYRDRTFHYLPADKNILQQKMNEIQDFCQIQKIKINEKKTQTVVFNVATSKDFYPRIQNLEGTLYNNVEHFNLLGVDLSTDKKKGISFDTYINECIKKGYKKLWILRRLAELGVSIENLL